MERYRGHKDCAAGTAEKDEEEMIEDETSPELHVKEPVLKWAESFANDIGTSYLLRDESLTGHPVVGGYIVDNDGFILLLSDDNSDPQPLFHHQVDVDAARKAVEADYLKTLANSTNHDASQGADDEQLVHQG
jgi:hypothetical protein